MSQGDTIITDSGKSLADCVTVGLLPERDFIVEPTTAVLQMIGIRTLDFSSVRNTPSVAN